MAEFEFRGTDFTYNQLTKNELEAHIKEFANLSDEGFKVTLLIGVRPWSTSRETSDSSCAGQVHVPWPQSVSQRVFYSWFPILILSH